MPEGATRGMARPAARSGGGSILLRWAPGYAIGVPWGFEPGTEVLVAAGVVAVRLSSPLVLWQCADATVDADRSSSLKCQWLWLSVITFWIGGAVCVDGCKRLETNAVLIVFQCERRGIAHLVGLVDDIGHVPVADIVRPVPGSGCSYYQ
jgi:hypothetical protein